MLNLLFDFVEIFQNNGLQLLEYRSKYFSFSVFVYMSIMKRATQNVVVIFTVHCMALMRTHVRQVHMFTMCVHIKCKRTIDFNFTGTKINVKRLHIVGMVDVYRVVLSLFSANKCFTKLKYRIQVDN